jgi:hypothetical protein
MILCKVGSRPCLLKLRRSINYAPESCKTADALFGGIGPSVGKKYKKKKVEQADNNKEKAGLRNSSQPEALIIKL